MTRKIAHGFLAFLGCICQTVSGTAQMIEKPGFFQKIEINRPIGDVWDAITKKSKIDNYYLAPIGGDISTEGQDIYYGTANNKMITGVVLEFSHPAKLKHSFRFTGSAKTPESVVTYHLKSVNGRTSLQIEHTGYNPDSQSYADISMGWSIILNGLKKVLEQK